MIQQYDRLKSQHRDAVLFFRLGDFYEMFRHDAKEASAILGLTLTARSGIPMCGIPHHAVRSYIPKLLEAGKKVAICEQINIPEKGIAERQVLEVLTPGTVIDESYLDKYDHNFIGSMCRFRGEEKALCASFIDVSTGELIISDGKNPAESLRRDIHLYNPRELLVQESLFEDHPWLDSELGQCTAIVNRFPDWHYEDQGSWEMLCEIMKVNNLKAYGFEKQSPWLDAVKPLLQYVETNTGKQIRYINSLRMIKEEGHLVIDSSSQRNLEIIHNRIDGTQQTTLFSTIDQTRTAMGRRLLKQWLLQPLINLNKIQKRQNRVSFLYHNQLILNTCREILGSTLDLVRLSMRVSMEKAHPRDMLAIHRSLESYIKLGKLLSDADFADFFVTEDFPDLEKIAKILSRALTDNPPIAINEGGIFRNGFDTEIDYFRRIETEGQQMLQDYLQEERDNSSIQNLKIKHNGVVGYFLEVSKGQLKNVPPHFERRQSLVTADRFTTPRLKELAEEIHQAQENLMELERTAFLALRKETQDYLPLLFTAGEVLAKLDCLQSLGYQATLFGYTCPKLVEKQLVNIEGGRHPVVEAFQESGSFVPNDLLLQHDNFFALITGPNMAGKSTYLRQNALIVLLAHIGGFVPAEAATIGVVDRIFCRVGASDDLARGESTFLVEMNETAHILRNATSKSLVIMDEVGRGTSTQDGLAIAWAVSEYILQHLRCHTLFATHFHEMSDLEHAGLQNFSLQVKEEDGNIIFLNKVIQGPSNNSYGLHVAQLAGIPEEVIFRAGEILEGLQTNSAARITQGSTEARPAHSRVQKSLFAQDELVVQEIRSLDINALTPVEALNQLNRMQNMLEE